MNIGIIGLGHIATTMARTIKRLKNEDIRLYAVASRTALKAKRFAKRFGVDVHYGSYEELFNDPKVDLVYVATPHALHFECAVQAIKAHKPVLIEKPITTDFSRGELLFKEAEKERVFIAEAMWTRYMPSRKIIQDTIDSGIIGKVVSIRADLSYAIEYKKRMLDPSLGGGALLDLGVYPLNFACMFIKDDPLSINASCTYTNNHLDETDTFTLSFPNNVIAELSCSMRSFSDKRGIIQGTDGHIEVDNINNPQAIRIFNNKQKQLKKIKIQELVSGYEYELLECEKALKEGKLEPPSMPSSESLRMLKIYDDIRTKLGIVYPFDSKEHLFK